MRASLRALSLVVLAGAAHAAFAWSATGHMVIAAIAKRELTPYALSEAERLLKVGATDRATDFISSGPWADDVRNDHPESGPWHYINLHFRSDRKRVTNQPEKDNVVAAIEKFRKILADKSKSDAERADALRYLIHFVGDIHQPLHAVARDSDAHPQGDRGGNDFDIQPPFFLANQPRPPRNLHSLWDSGVGLFPYIDRPLTADGRKTVQAQADAFIASLPRDSMKDLSHRTPMEWAQESLAAAKKTVYDIREGTVPGQEYVENGQRLVAQRATLAGYRLADILNESLR